MARRPQPITVWCEWIVQTESKRPGLKTVGRWARTRTSWGRVTFKFYDIYVFSIQNNRWNRSENARIELKMCVVQQIWAVLTRNKIDLS